MNQKMLISLVFSPALAAQDRFTLKAPNGIAFSEIQRIRDAAKCCAETTQEAPMTTNAVLRKDAAIEAGVARVDMKLEVVVISVSDVCAARFATSTGRIAS